jgi:hypothetical protein
MTLPWWCIFIAYGLCIILVGISILFIIARGIEFGDLKTQQWLTSILSGFFSSIFLTQPIKVKFFISIFLSYRWDFFLFKILCLAIFFAFFCQKSSDDIEAHEHLDDNKFNLEKDEDYLHSIEVCF